MPWLADDVIVPVNRPTIVPHVVTNGRRRGHLKGSCMLLVAWYAVVSQVLEPLKSAHTLILAPRHEKRREFEDKGVDAPLSQQPLSATEDKRVESLSIYLQERDVRQRIVLTEH